MSLPKEPRQLMINLMYLVLTAMLALNVSSEILHAFKTINQSITSSNASIEDKNSKIYDSFQAQEDDPVTHDRIKPFNDRAKEIKTASESMIKYLEDWKERIIQQAGGYEIHEGKKEIKNESDIDASTLLLVEKKGGDSVKAKILELREKLLSVVNPADKEVLAKQIPLNVLQPEKTDNNPTSDWSVGNFQSMPTMAAVTLFTKFQNDVRNSEALVLNQLNKEAGDVVVKFDEIAAIAVPKNSYALVGQKIEANILLAAYNKAKNPSVSSNTGRVVKVENGVALWETVASSVGQQTVKGQVTLDMGGRMITKDYTFQYTVGSTGASIQLDKMNVFYIGVPNPITVSAAGYSVEDISVNIPGADISAKEKGKYDVMVSKPGTVQATIMAKTATGPKQVGEMEIRVKNIPDPVAKVANKSGGVLNAAVFRAQAGIVAALDQFDFDAKFVVTSYDFSYLPKRGEYQGPFPVTGARFNQDNRVSSYQQNSAKAGDKIFIENIKARGPDGRTRSLNSLLITLN